MKLWLMDTAKRVAKESYCKRMQVGAIITKHDRIQSSGYNGMPKGLLNDCEDFENKTHTEVLHAEANAILFAAREGIPLLGTTLYVTMSPCIECSKMILQSGITTVIYNDKYRCTKGIDLLKRAGVTVKQFKEK